MIQKTCRGPCGRTLDLHRNNFGIELRRKDGFCPICLQCRREYNRARRLAIGDAPDLILSHSPFRRGDVCEFRGRSVRVSHGLQHGSSARIAVYPVGDGRVSMVPFRAFVDEARRVGA